MGKKGRGSVRAGNGKPPEQPEEEKKVIAVNTEVVRRAHDTTAQPTEEGGLVIEHVVQCEGEFQLHRYIVGEQGKGRIREAASTESEPASRLVVPDAPAPPADLRGQGGGSR